jgi:hypothetical protein
MKPYTDSPRLLRIFLCHSSGDKPAIRRLYLRLRADGFEPWLDEEKLLPGQRWRDEIPRAVRDSDVVIVCLSRASAGKAGYVQREIKYALDIALEQPEDAIFLIPLKLEECEMPDSLNEWQWVNFFEENGYGRLKMALDYRAEALHVSVTPIGQTDSSDASKTTGEPTSGKGMPGESWTQAPPTVKVSTAADEHGGKIIPHAIGIETLGGVFTKLIPEGTQLPHRFSEIFSTATDNQTSVEVHVLAGIRPLAQQNLSLGKFHLVGIPPAPRGMPQIEVTFDIDADGILNVSALDKGTGRRQKLTITSTSGPTKEEIAKILRDAKSFAAEDEAKRQLIESRNRLDGLIYQVRKTFSENRPKLSSAVESQVWSALAEAQKTLEEGEVVRMNNSFDDLQAASHRLAEELYRK